jgi:hypothetical protein
MCPDTEIPNADQSTPTTVSSDTLSVPEDSPQALRRTTLSSVPEHEYPNSVPSNLPNAINLSDHDDDIEQVRTNTLSRRSSLSSGMATPVPLTHRSSRISTASNTPSQSRWRSQTPRNSIFTLASLVSRPPSYKRFDPIESNPTGDDGEDEGHHLGGLRGLQTQFYGVYFAFWLVVLAFVGAVSVFVPSLPPVALLLWIPLVVYLGVSIYLLHKRRQEKAAMEAAAPERERRESRLRELLHAMRLPDSYFFHIDNQKEHRHPVVTLLPPPPTYASENNSNLPQPAITEIPPTPPTFYPNTTQEDEDYVRINLHGLIDAEHRDEQRQIQA